MIKIELSEQTLQTICDLLAKYPFRRVASILVEIQRQVEAQRAGAIAKQELDDERAKQVGNGSEALAPPSAP